MNKSDSEIYSTIAVLGAGCLWVLALGAFWCLVIAALLKIVFG